MSRDHIFWGEKWEPKRIRTKVPLLTNLTPYRRLNGEWVPVSTRSFIAHSGIRTCNPVDPESRSRSRLSASTYVRFFSSHYWAFNIANSPWISADNSFKKKRRGKKKGCCWSVLYSAVLRSRVDSLRSHVILHEWLAFYSVFLNIHRGGVLTALTWLVPHETAAVSSRSVYTIQPSTLLLHAKSHT